MAETARIASPWDVLWVLTFGCDPPPGRCGCSGEDSDLRINVVLRQKASYCNRQVSLVHSQPKTRRFCYVLLDSPHRCTPNPMSAIPGSSEYFQPLWSVFCFTHSLRIAAFAKTVIPGNQTLLGRCVHTLRSLPCIVFTAWCLTASIPSSELTIYRVQPIHVKIL